MAELNNPLFEDEKEFLERKKLEYERALRGDVEHIKEQSVVVGKVALAGAGVLGGLWLLSKAFGGKKKRRRAPRDWDGPEGNDDHDDYDPNAEYFTDGMGVRHQYKHSGKSAQASAQAFAAADSAFDHDGPNADHFGLGHDAPDPAADKYAVHSLAFEEDDPFQSLPYDDSRRMPASHEFEGENHADENYAAGRRAGRSSNGAGQVLQVFLQSDTGKMLVAQAAAVVLALVTKKVSEFFPASPAASPAKNSDLAAASATAPVSAGAPYSDPAPAATDASSPAKPV